MEELAAAMAEELVQTDLDFKSGVTVLLVGFQVAVFDKGYLFVGGFGGEDVAQRDVFETNVLTNVIIVGNVDAGGDAAVCQYGTYP